MTLKELNPGDQAVIKKINGAGAVKRRIMDMGVTKGCPLLVRKKAPLGDPVEINIRGYELTLRKTECELIEVDQVAEAA